MEIKTFRLCMTIFALLVFFGCSKQIDRSMLIGKYIANHGMGIDTLELKPDGTYIYYYRSADGKVFTNTNRWQFEYENKEPRITFDEFIFGHPGHGTPIPGFWDVEVELSLTGRIRLYTDLDLNYYYEKQAR